jgi:hypothetical protein
MWTTNATFSLPILSNTAWYAAMIESPFGSPGA